jgi:hypothetical protein
MDWYVSKGRRRVKHTLQAWKTSLPDGPLPATSTRSLKPVGEPILIWPLEEIEVLRWVRVNEEPMALVLWHDRLYLVTYQDLETQTIPLSMSYL